MGTALRSYTGETVPEQRVNVTQIRPSTSLAEVIRQARGALTQEYVAGKLGVNVTTVQRWEAGLNSPRGKNAVELRRLLGISDDRLARGGAPTSRSESVTRPEVTTDEIARSVLEGVRKGSLRNEHALEALRAVSAWKGLGWPEPNASPNLGVDGVATHDGMDQG